MALPHHQAALIDGIISMSVSDLWDIAKFEWELVDVHHESDPDTCLCGHHPINEICLIRNKRNGNQTIVGNVCVKKFLGLASGKIFDAINRVRKDETKALNAEAIEHASQKKWITTWEYVFYMNTWRKRSLSGAQEQKRIEINKRVLQRTTNSKKISPPSNVPGGES